VGELDAARHGWFGGAGNFVETRGEHNVICQDYGEIARTEWKTAFPPRTHKFDCFSPFENVSRTSRGILFVGGCCWQARRRFLAEFPFTSSPAHRAIIAACHINASTSPNPTIRSSVALAWHGNGRCDAWESLVLLISQSSTMIPSAVGLGVAPETGFGGDPRRTRGPGTCLGTHLSSPAAERGTECTGRCRPPRRLPNPWVVGAEGAGQWV